MHRPDPSSHATAGRPVVVPDRSVAAPAQTTASRWCLSHLRQLIPSSVAKRQGEKAKHLRKKSEKAYGLNRRGGSEERPVPPPTAQRPYQPRQGHGRQASKRLATDVRKIKDSAQYIKRESTHMVSPGGSSGCGRVCSRSSSGWRQSGGSRLNHQGGLSDIQVSARGGHGRLLHKRRRLHPIVTGAAAIVPTSLRQNMKASERQT